MPPKKRNRTYASKGLSNPIDRSTVLTRQLKINRTPLALAFQHLEPSWRGFLFYVDQAAKEGDEEMAKIIQAYTKMTKYEQNHYNSPEYLCEIAGVSVRTLISSIMPLVYDYGHFESLTVKSLVGPRALGRLGKEAMKSGPAHHRDRELFMKVTGDLPVPRGTTINNQNQFAAVGSTGSLIGKQQSAGQLPSPGQDVMEMESGDTDDEMGPV